ncbi:hypothetical protein [Okeania sp. SIO3B5]|nr:hypothetical protein [Okeania sp. SIO3B5]
MGSALHFITTHFTLQLAFNEVRSQKSVGVVREPPVQKLFL